MPNVHIIFGPPGAGKTTFAAELAEAAGAVQFGIDPWMQCLYGDDRPSQLTLEWALARTRRCEAQIWQVARQLLSLGVDVVLDLGAMTAPDRARLRDAALAAGGMPVCYFVDADSALRRQRVMARNVDKPQQHAFELTPAMFEAMEAYFERPAGAELEGLVHV
ncbi:ATP-binding protein [Cupriavidus sp. AU9028]|uniref:AAA family ATPase n=1 Tax=Cupriavidus sp. AU9028 TaxID=2871157 RepID=UPI001C97ECDB|nr:ATP-binding protein [Cupriavidus sp. AU9028]MBY4897860.1 ATP-binding protein [Cupriavidus sp. AU9028]